MAENAGVYFELFALFGDSAVGRRLDFQTPQDARFFLGINLGRYKEIRCFK